MADSVERDTAAEVREAVENYFKAEGAKYKPFDERGVAHATYGVDVKFGHVEVFFHAYHDMLILHLIVPLKAGEDERVKVGEFLHRANYGLKLGNFDFDFNDGEVSYRVVLYCGMNDFEPPRHEQIDAALSIGLMMIDKYGDDLVKVMFGLAEPLDAIAAVDNEDE